MPARSLLIKASAGSVGNVSACHGPRNLLSLSRVVLWWELCCFSSRFPKGSASEAAFSRFEGAPVDAHLESLLGSQEPTRRPPKLSQRSGLSFREDIWDYSGSEIILAAGLKTRFGDGIAPLPSRLRSQTSDLEAAGSPARSGMLRDRSLVSVSPPPFPASLGSRPICSPLE